MLPNGSRAEMGGREHSAEGLAESPAAVCDRNEVRPAQGSLRLGGWNNRPTILICYQRADAMSMQQALAARRRFEAWR
jgi:hypothetical protein